MSIFGDILLGSTLSCWGHTRHGKALSVFGSSEFLGRYNTQKRYTALGVLVCFSLFVQMAEGTTYGIVPFVAKQQLAVWSFLVCVGGNLGAVIAGWCFYKPIEDDWLPVKVHGLYVMF